LSLRFARLLGCRGRLVVVAMDHGGYAGPISGLTSIGGVLERILGEDFDAVILCPGAAVKYASLIGRFRKQLILRVDGARTALGRGVTKRISSVRDALRIGADAVIAMGYVGCEEERDSLSQLASIATECREWCVPLIAEMLPMEGGRICTDPDKIGLAARIGAEIGADLIKTYYTGSLNTFRRVVEGCFAPIIIAGGPKIESARSLLEMVKSAINAGAIGVAFGRNVWQYREPTKMIRAIARIVYEDADVEVALKELT